LTWRRWSPDAKKKVRESLFLAYRDVQRGVRETRWKLIEYTVAGKRTTQLFDLAADPWEVTNLAGEARHGKTIARLRGELGSWQKRLRDPM
jgi:arylsulfatase A-like enzyme